MEGLGWHALWTWAEKKRRNGGGDGDEGKGEKEWSVDERGETALNLFLFWVSLPTEFRPVARRDVTTNFFCDTKTPKNIIVHATIR